MGTTPVYAFRYPELTDSPNSPTQVQNLALDVEARIEAIYASIAASRSLSDVQSANGTTTSTTFTATLTGGTACGIAFVAPASGVVIIHNSLGLFNTADFSICTIEVRTGSTIGSGTVVLAASDDYAIVHKNANLNQFGRATRLPGLTPGGSYNVRQQFRVPSGTGNFQRKELIVQLEL